jgi:hypothetical protein
VQGWGDVRPAPMTMICLGDLGLCTGSCSSEISPNENGCQVSLCRASVWKKKECEECAKNESESVTQGGARASTFRGSQGMQTSVGRVGVDCEMFS